MNNQNKNNSGKEAGSLFGWVDALPEPDRTGTYTDISEIVASRMERALSAALNTEQVAELNKLAEGGATPSQVEEWFRGNVPGYDELRDKVAAQLDQELTGQQAPDEGMVQTEFTDVQSPEDPGVTPDQAV